MGQQPNKNSHDSGMNCCVIFLYDGKCEMRAMIIMMTALGFYAMYYNAVYIKEELVSIPASSHFR